MELEKLIGKEVQIYPGDTHKKFGKILEVREIGILFLITRVGDDVRDYTVGARHFIGFGSNLSFKEVI